MPRFIIVLFFCICFFPFKASSENYFTQTLIFPIRYKLNGAIRGISIDSKNKRIYVGSTDQHLYCLDGFGNIKWKSHVDSDIHRVIYDPNYRQIYCRYKQCQHLGCFSDEGLFLWSVLTGNVHGIDIDPYTGNIYCSCNSHLKGSTILCISPKGELMWEKRYEY